MSWLDRVRGSVAAEDGQAPPAGGCPHANREDMRTFGAGGSAANRWRCKDCGYTPLPGVR